MTWSRIVCAVDASVASDGAIVEAARLAKALGARLTLVHVCPRPPAPEPLLAPPPLPRGTRSSPPLETWSEAASRIRGEHVPVHVLDGDVAGELLAFARRSADVLLMGTHARRRMSLALGSNVARVLAGAECPVVVVQASAD
jgi:universal stress protein A